MFEYSIVHWTTFLTAAILLNISPGPDMAFILGQTARGGIKGGFSAMFGIWTGAFIHVLLASFGLSAILMSSASAFTIVKWLGVMYLCWLGLQSFMSKGILTVESEEKAQALPVFWQGVLVSVLNPKVAIFFLAFLPQFVTTDGGPIGAQLFLHGSIIILVAAFIEPPIVLSGSKLLKKIQHSKKVELWMDRSLGVLFFSLGINLAVSEFTK